MKAASTVGFVGGAAQGFSVFLHEIFVCGVSPVLRVIKEIDCLLITFDAIDIASRFQKGMFEEFLSICSLAGIDLQHLFNKIKKGSII